MPTFNPPTEDTVPPVYLSEPDRFYPVPRLSRRLFRHYKNRARGVTVLKDGGTYTEVRSPSSDEIEAADAAYLGGHCNVVSTAEATLLQAAGYTTADNSLYSDIYVDHYEEFC